MDIYLVGGAVRDRLLGLPPGDRDWVVVGATPQRMLDQGFKPVGRDFPVFLHPRTGEEYALARTERKSGRGYRGFVVDSDPSVTLGGRPAAPRFHRHAMARTPTAGCGPLRRRARHRGARPAPRGAGVRGGSPAGCCARRASWPASPRSASPWPLKPWP
jgi:hypothetical protein